jgi:hypothetical protein
MLGSAVPPKFPIPWANSAGGGAIRAIPTASQIGVQPGAASLTDGFPPLNMLPLAAGGIPPFGQDMNGALNQITAWLRWLSAGGAAKYDAVFVTAIGGYPSGAILASNTGHVLFENFTDNNTADPNVSGAGWFVVASVWSEFPWTAGGSANAQTIALTPAPTSLAQLVGVPLWIKSQGTNTGATTLAVNSFGALALQNPGGGALPPAQLTAGLYFAAVYNGSAFQMIAPTSLPGRLIGTQIFPNAGTYVYAQTPGTARVEVEGVGGGGGGGGAVAAGAGNAAGASPGNAGAYGRGTYTSGFSGVTITIGAGGGGFAGSGGANGGPSSFGSLLVLPYGPGGALGLAQAGSASNGNPVSSGLPTGANIVGAVGGFGGFSFGFTNGQVAFGGQGGQSYYGAGGAAQQANLAGQASLSPGGGGGGTIGISNTSPLTGGNGSPGLIIVREYSQ